MITCRGCGARDVTVFYEATGVPAHSVLLMPTREEAVGYPRGDVRLGLCRACGFISNVAFDPSLHQYSGRYEETQGFSATFNAFHETLADRLIERHDLRDKTVIEIGCGKGEFLTLLCEKGGNRGVGFDPSYVAERRPEGAADRTRFVTDFYSERYGGERADLVCCKMTLEHIRDAAEFVAIVRRTIGCERGTVVFFQVPDARRILEEAAFWDIYYEHCSYFTPGSLARLFRRAGFAVTDLDVDFDGQYLLIEARPADDRRQPDDAPCPIEESPAETASLVERFASRAGEVRAAWRRRLDEWSARGATVVIWGAGSKGVSFLTTLAVDEEVTCAVDINPYKHGTFMPGRGHEIVSPERLRDLRPDAVIVMNPIYLEEIRRDLTNLGLDPEIVAV